MKKLVIGILAHVDAGKTTLSESMLYLSGKIGKLGRVDNKDAYLDTYELEKARGITIFSKQAIFKTGDTEVILLDTPGHVDFSAEMERTLQILDYAILVVSGADGVQGHTKTLWNLLRLYNIPAFLFVNKMDQNGTDKAELLKELQSQLSSSCIDFSETETNEFYDQLAMCNEKLMDEFLSTGVIKLESIIEGISRRKVFPCYFGSALRLIGVEQFMQGVEKYSQIPNYTDEFGAKIFKITRDEQGNRLTHMKITGGKLKIRDVLSNGKWEEKINQIRVYSGTKFEAVNELSAGSVCAVMGLTQTRSGEGLGLEDEYYVPVLEPVLSYQIRLPIGCDPKMMLPKLRLIEEEEPELHIVWDEQLQEIQAQIMGEVQIEILQSMVLERFGVKITFDDGRIVYKETIQNTVEGVGHFEPLRHYAEVHLILEPNGTGSGVEFATMCSEDILSKSWQRLIMTHLEEKIHRGVLTGAAITDIKITLVSGRAHKKHTEGGDFREATYRAVRNGLKQAKSMLLEPYYTFQLELPEKMVGRAMNDIEKMSGISEISHTDGETAVLVGSAPVITMRNYQKDVIAYTKGQGRLFCSFKGYEACHNEQEIIDQIGYDSERDFRNPTGSVFCAHGSGFLVEWYDVKNFMHLESVLQYKDKSVVEAVTTQSAFAEEKWISPEEVDSILNKTYFANQSNKSVVKKRKTALESYYKPEVYAPRPKEDKDEYLLVDGYNIIFAWPELKEIANDNMEGARTKLMDSLCNYQGIRKNNIIVVFDAYRLQGHREEVVDYYNIHMVYTKEAQTADQYIERFAHVNKNKYDITVATSDGLQQIIIRGAGSSLLSARELKIVIEEADERTKREYNESLGNNRNVLEDSLTESVRRQMKDITNNNND